MHSTFANFWAIVLLLLGSNMMWVSGPGPNRVSHSVGPDLAAASNPGELVPFDGEPGKFRLPDGVIEERTEEEDSSDSQDHLGFSRPSLPFLPHSPTPSADLSCLGVNASIRVLRITCLRC